MAYEAMRPFLTEAWGNASALHQHGLRARQALERARGQCAVLIGAASPEEIIFTSSGTEAVNLAIKGVAHANQRRGRHLVASAIEHPAVLNSLEFLETQGFTITRLGVNADGLLNSEELHAALSDQTVLVCVHQANYDIGVVQNLQALARVAGERGVPVFVDATFSGGWLPIDVQALGVQLLALAPHRFYGPKGVGVLYRNRRARLTSLIHGGVQEGGRRAGTENVAAIVGAGVAAEAAARDLAARLAHTTRLQVRLWKGLANKIPYLRLNGSEPGPKRLCTNLNVSVEFTEGEGLVLFCDTRGVAISSGTACVSRATRASPVLQAIGLDHSLALGAILLSPGQENTDDDIDYALDVLTSAVTRFRSLSAAWEDFRAGRIRSKVQASDS